VIEAIDNTPVPTPEHWAVHMDRLSAGQPVTLQLRRASSLQASSPQEVTITAQPLPPPADRPLGLKMRTVARVGAEVLSVAPASAAERAGLLAGDIVTRAGDRDAPTAAELMDAFKESADRPLLVAVTRGATHHVLALEPR
jgi:C-terminal processing protease CtpA/Prc